MTTKNFLRPVFLLSIMFASKAAMAHVVIDEIEKMSKADVAWLYLKLGYQHILPLGLDHILFVLSLFLLSPKPRPIILQSTAFTVAHSVTLGLAMYGIIAPPTHIIEPLIALSIVFVALENIFSPQLRKTRFGLVFLFGLVHGLGFASSLSQTGLPKENQLSSLILFNAGVELGQLTVILLAFFIVGKWFGDKPFYRRRIVIPLSFCIVLVAGFWTVQRIFFP